MSILYYSVTVEFSFLDNSFVSAMVEAESFSVLLREKNIHGGGYFYFYCVNIIL